MSLKFLYDDSYCMFCCVTDPIRSTQGSSLLCRDNSCYQVWRCQWQISLRALMWAYDRWVVLWSGYSEVTYRLCISGCSQWFWHSRLASILSPVLCINSLATQCGSRVASAWSFVSGSAVWSSAGPWILHDHVLRAHLRFQSTVFPRIIAVPQLIAPLE